MMLATLIAYVDRQTLAVLSPMILADTGLTAASFADALSAFSIAYMLANPLWGSILDRTGLRVGMAIAVGVWTLASGAHAIVAGFLGFAVARVILGLGEGAGFPGCVKMAADCLPTSARSRGIALGYCGAALGSLITPLTMTPFALQYGWRAAFWITGALGVAWLILWWSSAKAPLIPDIRRDTKIVLPSPFLRRFWYIVATYGMGAVALGVIAYMSPLYLNRALGLSQRELGYVLWIPTLGWFAGYFFWGWVSDRLIADQVRPVKTLLILSALALPSAFVTMFHSWQAAVAFFVWAMFIADGFIVMGLHIGSRAYPRDQVGMVGGIGGGSWSAVLAVILPFYGRMIDAGSYTMVFVTMSLLPLLGSLLYLALSAADSKGNNNS